MPYKDIELRREKNRRWRAANPGYYAKYRAQDKAKRDQQAVDSNNRHPERRSARRKIAWRVNESRQWPQPSFFKCSDCEAQAQHYHHEDYSQPLIIEPLCHKCHGIRHRAD